LNKTVVGLLTAILVSFGATVAHAATLGVPSYSYPGTEKDFWSQLPGRKDDNRTGRRDDSRGAIYVINPNSGVGTLQDATYEAVVKKARAQGVTVYGYVFTHYGNRPASEIKKEVAPYKAWYGVHGIFLDETQLDKEHWTYYAGLSQMLLKSGLQIAFNPGQAQIDPHFMNLAHHVVTFEGSYVDYQIAVMPTWTRSFPAKKFWHMIYDAPDLTAFQQTLNLTRKNNAGVVFITNDKLPNPYDEVPPYWSQEIKLLQDHKTGRH